MVLFGFFGTVYISGQNIRIDYYIPSEIIIPRVIHAGLVYFGTCADSIIKSLNLK